eukprot:TRINITY_DN13894_c0_g1_i1.p1 TRINITY_DN13894_c0_g1~~TRINITY_DN13894_c0_g1_i1.p1  ORF type:complete len:317 (-),score=55.30 TRINITY_DN13894_c0_g1_i1:1017-1967(-)
MSMFAAPVNGTYDISATLNAYTYVFNRFSCITWMYPIHIAFAYLVVASGLLALLARIIPLLKPYHSLFGRLYVIFMLWCMASSLLIHNAGLPFPIIISFLYLLGGITFGWISIYIHIRRFEANLWKRLEYSLKEALSFGAHVDLAALRQAEIRNIVDNKSFVQRLFSLKALHGIMFAFSWAQMLGRTVVTNPGRSWSGCWSYPAYKSVTGQAVFVESIDPSYFPMGETNFLLMVTLPTVLIVLAVAIIGSCCGSCFAAKRRAVAADGVVLSSMSHSQDGGATAVSAVAVTGAKVDIEQMMVPMHEMKSPHTTGDNA